MMIFDHHYSTVLSCMVEMHKKNEIFKLIKQSARGNFIVNDPPKSHPS